MNPVFAKTIFFLRRTAFLASVCAFPVFRPSFTQAANPFEEYVRSTPHLSPEDEQKSFVVPDGFEIQLVAAEPRIGKPISMSFDARGRLWVAETRMYPVESAPDKTPRDTITILSDFAPDGRAQKIETFAGELNTPDAIAPCKSGAIAFSIPNIIRLEDTNGDGRADQRAVLYGPFETRDTHNMANNFRRGFDGWFYGGHGVANKTTVHGTDGHSITMNGSTFRFRGDGSRIELFGRGQVNPFGVCFDPAGNVYESDCHSSPIYQLIRGAYYPSFGKPDDGLGFGPVMMRHSHGSTAIAGLCYYDDDLWPAEFRGNMFLGNVMTSRVNRDQLLEVGSTPIAREMPDLVSSSDPWFRPVDVQLGPDGALYIADFYNRIIAHVEVPLTHPGRDRQSGRIWRLVYRGPNGNAALHAVEDLDHAEVTKVVTALGAPNFTTRLLALNELADRGGADVLAAAHAVLSERNASASATISGALWILERLGSLQDAELARAWHHADALVRVHAQRILCERTALRPAERTAAVAALHDPDPLVNRVAADALARHPAFENVAPLLALRHRAPVLDTHLVFMSRKALRDQLLDSSIFSRLLSEKLSDEDLRAIGDVALAVPNAASATFLLASLDRAATPPGKISAQMRHIARYIPETGLEALANFARQKFGNEIDFQVELFHSVQQGFEQRGAEPNPTMRAWGAEIAGKLLDATKLQRLDWTNTPLDAVENKTNPWFVQNRPSADGDTNALFLCSLPPGGESLTGVLRSAPFVIPSTFTFWIAGHDGFPTQPPHKKNLVRLRATDSSEVLAQAPAPRNDMAQRVSWELGAQRGREGVLELVDADTGSAYAWIAAGRFDPPLISVPKVSPNTLAQRQTTAARLVRILHLTNLDVPLAKLRDDTHADAEARAAAASALLAIGDEKQLAPVAALLNDPNLSRNAREQLGNAVIARNSAAARQVMKETLRVSPQELQLVFARNLAGSSDGAELLFQCVRDGLVSPQLLVDRTVKEKLVAARSVDANARIAELTAGLKPQNERLVKLVAERRAAFLQTQPDRVHGAQVFNQTCAVCHSIGGTGGAIGPQLDGVGNRGLDRLCEDIIDPNRNVDRVFRYSVLTLKNGEVLTGLFRREEGDVLVFADATGKEFTALKRDIGERRESDTSLMPEVFGDALPPRDFFDLLGFLLSQRSPLPKAPQK
jgi:putative heme-binding domain-containing protein